MRMRLENIYEPNEDTYTLIDVLEKNKDIFANKVILEIGCGSGEVLDFISHSCSNSFLIGTDINPDALDASKNRLKNCNLLLTHLLGGISQEGVDIIIFNPPYVETEYQEHTDITASYSGGYLGRIVIDKFIKCLKVPAVFLLVTRKNNPREIILELERKGYGVEVVQIRRILAETLVVLKAVM